MWCVSGSLAAVPGIPSAKFHWRLQHWLNECRLVYRRIYASLGFNELSSWHQIIFQFLSHNFYIHGESCTNYRWRINRSFDFIQLSAIPKHGTIHYNHKCLSLQPGLSAVGTIVWLYWHKLGNRDTIHTVSDKTYPHSISVCNLTQPMFAWTGLTGMGNYILEVLIAW